MATYRGNTKGINDSALKEAINKYCGQVAVSAASAGKQLMEQVRSAAVRGWYQSTSADAMNMATTYTSKIKQKNGNYTITITSSVDEDAFEQEKEARSTRDYYKDTFQSLVDWRRRHEIGNRGSDGKIGGTGYWTYYNREPSQSNPLRATIPMPYSIGEYLFRLPWERGIKGLPPYEEQTGTGWRNPKPLSGKGILKKYVSKRLKAEWTNENIKKYM